MIIFILILAAVLRLIGLDQSFWLDEAIQAVISSKPLTAIDFGADFQPPLFYTLAHFWLSIGIKSEWFLRLPNVFFGVLTVYLTFYFFKKLINRQVGHISAIFLATAPFHIYYSQEFRMYSMLTLLTLLSWIFLWQKLWILYGITILLSVFTHYFAAFAIASQFLFVLIYNRKNISSYIIHTSLFLIPFLLWLPTLAKQFNTARSQISLWPRWGEVLGVSIFKFIPLVLAKFTVGVTSPDKIIYIPAVIVAVTVFLMAISKLFHFRSSQHSSPPPRWKILSISSEYALLIFSFFLPLIAAWILGFWVSANTPHRVLFILPAFYGIIAAGLDKIKKRKLKIILISIILISNVSFSGFYLLNSTNHRENWRDAVSYTDKIVGERGLVLSTFHGPWTPMIWYSKKANKYEGSTNLSSIENHDPIILYAYLFEIFDPERNVEKNILKNGFKLTSEKDFRGVGIVKVFNAQQK